MHVILGHDLLPTEAFCELHQTTERQSEVKYDQHERKGSH